MLASSLGSASAAPTRRSSLFRVHRISAIEYITRPYPTHNYNQSWPRRAECPPNTKMSSPTSQSLSTTSVPGPRPVIFLAHTVPPLYSLGFPFLLSLGLGNYQGWIRRPGSPKMLFPVIVGLNPLSVRVRGLHKLVLSSLSSASGGRSTFESWRALSKETFS